MTKIEQIAEDVRIIRERLVEKTPGHFGLRHIGTAFFGALFFGFTFVLKGLLFEVGLRLTNPQLWIIVMTTLIILSIQIYFIGYLRVPDKSKRKFGQFWLKRIITYYSIAIFTSTLLLYTYGTFDVVITAENALKLIIAVSFPTAIGAGGADLLQKY